MWHQACDCLKGLAMRKHKVIIDTDPGVDDSACLAFAFFDKRLDIKLLTTVSGNVNIKFVTRNLLHLLDRFDVDFPVAVGSDKPLVRERKSAEYIHSASGMGGYTPPKEVHHSPIKEDAIEAMYRVLKEGNGDISIIALGPQTNVARLLTQHPDIVSKIPRIVFMGGSPYGVPGFSDHISFNISSDPEAFKIVLESKIPLVMIPYDMGRREAYLPEDFVYGLRDTNDFGKFLYQMYSTYWEPNFPDKRIATNDTCAYLYLAYPHLFTCKRVEVDVDLVDVPGKTLVKFNKNGHVLLTVKIKREQFLKFYLNKVKKIGKILDKKALNKK